ncbi:class I SAM-dependent methyltransferase [Thalassospira lucentensis]|uniref:class I SAM-dependent methyltransferase n=1 Tax=Thalassospira lucentensis TaxID=168935 RepID=UPI00399D64B0
MNHIDIVEAKEVYKNGENITQYLRNKFNETENTSEIIEIAYDLQAGSYISAVQNNLHKAQLYANELGSILNQHIESGDTLLDVGAGELTTLTFVLNTLDVELTNVLAFDISWSRLKKGNEFYLQNKKLNINVDTFVADIKEIPLHEKCVDVVTSSHALEPNGKNLSQLLNELFRVAKRKLVLFEPSYELNSNEGKKRMNSLGYIKGVEDEVTKLGGKVTDIIPITNAGNPLNPTACYVIEPPLSNSSIELDYPVFCVPGTNYKLNVSDYFLVSEDTGLLFPVLEEIPILRSKAAILATAKF